MAKFRKRFIGVAALVAVFFISAAAGWGAIDPSTVQKLVAGDGAAGDYFGSSVSLDGDTLVIGAKADDDNGDWSGSAYVFVRNQDGVWVQQAKLLPNDGAAYDQFGSAVSVSGDTIVVGAYGDDDNHYSGSAYVFVRNESGVWTQQEEILPADGSSGDDFGYSVSVSGNTVVIGAYGDDDKAAVSGSAYVFVRDEFGSWNQQDKLLAEDGAQADYFGRSVAIDGDTIVVSSDKDDDNGSDSGSAYIFVRDGFGNWRQEAKLSPSDGTDGQRFGLFVSISNDTVVSSVWGAIYVFMRKDGVWSQQAKFASDTEDKFSRVMSVSGDILVINGTPVMDAAYVFIRNEVRAWTKQAKLLAPDDGGSDWFGDAISVSGTTAVLSDEGDDDNGTGSGAVYVYTFASPTSSDVAVTVTVPASGTTYNHGNQVTIDWETENVDPADTMVLSMKRDAASTMTAPDNRSWYRFTDNTPNDGTANVAELYIEKSGDGLGILNQNDARRPPYTLCDINCTSQTSRFPVGTELRLTAEADTNSVFSGWEGCDLVVDDQCYITVNDYEEVFARFNAAEDATVELSVSFFEQPYEQGSVISNPPGISCSDSKGTCRAKFVPGQTVTLTPTAARGAIFEEWKYTWDSTPCSSQSGDACIITVPASGRINVRPNFAPDTQQNLNFVIEGNGSGSVTSTSGGINCSSDGTNTACNEVFEEGTEVTLNAVADAGSVFLRWDGWYVNPCFESDDPKCTFTMWWPHTVKAIFSAENLAVDVRSDVDVIDDGYTSYYIDVQNNGIADSGEAVVEIAASSVGNGEELIWRCVDEYNANRGICKKNGNTFTVTVKQNEHIKIIVARRYGSDVNTATLGAIVSYSKDADPGDNEKSVILHRDPATLGLRTDVRLQDSHNRWPPLIAPIYNTLVLTHGWQASDPDGCEGLQGQAMLECFSKQLWSGMNTEKEKGQAGGLADKNLDITSPNALDGQVNILQYIWAGAFTKTGMNAEGYIQARRHVFDAGRELAKLLIKNLGNDYQGKIHFVGHSLGTAVNAYAVRTFLDNLTEEAKNNVTIQMTILDHPNRVSKIGILFTDLSDKKEKQWGFDEYFFADVLPELDDPNKKNRLYVDNYFAAKTTENDTKISSAGVGTAISGENVYNHLKDKGLNNPNYIGTYLFLPETPNDHSGVQQWYRWTMWPDGTRLLKNNQFVCSDGEWNKSLILALLEAVAVQAGADIDSLFDNSLNPCNTGFAHSILREGWQPEDFPKRNGYKTMFSPAAEYDLVGGGATQRCFMVESSQYLNITCSNVIPSAEYALAADQSESAAAPIETASDYLHTKINLSKEIGNLSFEYRLTNTDTKEPVHLLIDGVVVWSMSAQSGTQGEWTASGKIPVALTKGEHTLMLAFNRTSEDAEFAMRELQFFEAPNKNGFLPAMLFLLLNK